MVGCPPAAGAQTPTIIACTGIPVVCPPQGAAAQTATVATCTGIAGCQPTIVACTGIPFVC